MKIFIVAVLVALAQAADPLKVKDKDGKTCILLTVGGDLALTATKGKDEPVSAAFKFSDASVLDTSDCTTIKLDLKKSVQVWFKLDEEKSGAWQVTPISAFVPKTAFGDKVNGTDQITGQADALGGFQRNESYLCNANVEHDFKVQGNATGDYTFTIKASTTNFQIQGGNINRDSFTAGEDCDQDKTSTPKPTTTPKPPATTTPKPGPPVNNYGCMNGNTTRINMTAALSLKITYETSKGYSTVTQDVPKDAKATGDCDSNKTESLTITFGATDAADAWSIQYTFQSDDPKNIKEYHVANITVKVPYSALKNATGTGTLEVDFASADTGFLKATNKGYYLCDSKVTKDLGKNVTLTTKDLKYKAFNSKEDAGGFSGDVSECSADEDTSSVVPIAVGAALAGLVVIVLIAYLIGRKRSRKSGYESV